MKLLSSISAIIKSYTEPPAGLAQSLTDFIKANFVKREATRNLQANRFYFGVVLPPIVEATGYTKEELHDIFKKLYNTQIKEVGGEMVEYGATTTKLTTKEFQEFVDRVIQWASEHDITIDIEERI